MRIATVMQQDIPVRITAVGSVEPIHSVAVKAQVSGPITDVLFEEGDTVEEGQVLFVIDKRPFEVALRQAEANLAKTRAQFEQTQATRNRDRVQATNAESVLTRDRDLLAKGMVSPEEFDKSRTDAEALQSSVAADEAAVKSATESIAGAEAAIDDAKLQLEYCEIRAPLTGKTGAVLLKKGNLVKANDSTAMVVINQTSPIYVSFSVPEKHLPDIQRYWAQGPIPVKAKLSGAGEPVAGLLTFIDNTVNADTGSIALKATFDNQDSRLWPGQFVEAVVELTVQSNAIVVPHAAIQTGQEGTYTYVVAQDMKAALRKVTTGISAEDLTVISAGLEPGEQVVTDGHLRLIDGTRVEVIADTSEEGASGG
ncbi:MAG TPA: efflux RND transporter periplasmic adaptor subunit [Candidatus Hydrogenedentes bacterium]|nr:efflux RND transporter periplasmic adaptor subunit [Candidatus Hydrogenedentota bacterium]HPG66124.1 efflux RND transporter periplasmic adaptor subunit [Candidatus Hydrogenedentota bacterium]